ncbi:MAG: CRTAC1 family protein [Planctomycetales bacterium]|nr:CRTAC1 family protein [Planctomycetales bacterium]
MNLPIASGLDFVHFDGNSGKQYLVELMCGGLATADFDNDGLIDIFFCNGAVLASPQGSTDAGAGASNRLFRNRSLGRSLGSQTDITGLHFLDVTFNSQANDQAFSLGVVTADFDNDGFEDLFVNNFGQNQLLHNNGDGTFSDATQVSGLDSEHCFGAGAVVADFDQDGDLDLFVGNYVDFDFTVYAQKSARSFPYPPGPKDFPPVPDALFLNQGNGTFVDASRSAGLQDAPGPSMGLTAGDFDNDGDQDVLVCNDGAPNQLWLNDGHAHFSEEGILAGIAYDLVGNANGSMGIEPVDLNGDGIEDFLITDYARQLPMLLMSYGPASYQDETRVAKLGNEVIPHVNWGVGLYDFDLDGDLDAFLSNGHFLEDAARIEPGTDFAIPNSLYLNEGANRFVDRSHDSGEAFSARASSRGCTFDDLDNDGDIDVAVLNCRSQAQVCVNVTQTKGKWIEVELVGTRINRSAVGARIIVATPEKSLARCARRGQGYQSSYGTRLHFGIQEANSVDLTVWWSPGHKQELHNVPVNQLLRIVEE